MIKTILKILLSLIAVVVVVFFALIPYNKYCLRTNNCNSIYFSDLFPKKQGMGFNIEFKALNYHELIEFKTLETDMVPSYTNKKIIAEFEVSNKFKKTVKFRPKLRIEPRVFEKYIIKHNCLCSQRQNVKSDEVKKLRTVFVISDEIEKDPLFVKEYFDQKLMDDQMESGNHYPKNIKIKYIIENTYW